jgi:hypothetical protein
MPLGIYTGQGLRAPRTPAYALQALSQFGIQEQARKTAEIEKSYKEREKFTDMLKIDPVYLASTKAQNIMAQDIDDFVNEMTSVYKTSGGRLSTPQLAKMSQARAGVMAKMGYMKAVDDEMRRAAQLVATDPRYDRPMFEEALKEWTENGVAPEGGFLYPAVQNPIIEYQNMVNSMGFKYETVTKETAISPTEERVEEYRMWDKRGYDENRLQDETASVPRQQLNIQGWFDRSVPENVQSSYIKKAGGDVNAAANMWYKDSTRGMVFNEMRRTDTRAYRDPRTYQEKEAEQTFQRGNMWFYNGKEAFIHGAPPTAIIDSGDGMSFAADAPTISIPADQLKFNRDIEFDKGSRIEVQPQSVVFENGEIEYSVDPVRNGEVWVIVDDEDEVPLREIVESIELPGGKHKYKGVLKAITAAGAVDDAMTGLDVNYGGTFSQKYNEWRGTQQPKQPTKKKQRGWRFLNPSKWLSGEGPPETEPMLEWQGSEYTEQELRSAGWTDADIERLKKQ